MRKKETILISSLIFALLSPCFLFVFQINSSIGIDKEQNKMNVNILSPPKSSGYAVTKKWNYTSDGIVNTIAVSGDGKYMAVGTEASAADKEILFFKTSSGTPLWSYETGCDIDSIAISNNGSYITASCDTGKAYLFNNSAPKAGQDKEEIWNIDFGLGINYISLDISADGQYIAVVKEFMFPTPWSVMYVFNNSREKVSKKDEYIWICTVNDYRIINIALSADGTHLVAGGSDHYVLFWNNTEYTLGAEHAPMWKYDAGEIIHDVAISEHGDLAVAGTDNQIPEDELFVFNKSAEGGQPEWSQSTGTIKSVAISSDGEYIAVGTVGCACGLVELWRNSTQAKEWYGETEWYITSVDITANGSYIAVGTEMVGVPTLPPIRQNTVFLFNNTFDTGNKLPEWGFNTTHTVNSVSISDDGYYIGTGGESTSGESFLFYHGPTTTILPPGAGDDDDDDDDKPFDIIQFFTTPIGLIIIATSITGIVIVIILIKKKR